MSRQRGKDSLTSAMWQQLHQITAEASEGLDRVIMGDENYDHQAQVAAEVRQYEHDRDLDLYRLAVRISRRNRGEE